MLRQGIYKSLNSQTRLGRVIFLLLPGFVILPESSLQGTQAIQVFTSISYILQGAFTLIKSTSDAVNSKTGYFIYIGQNNLTSCSPLINRVYLDGSTAPQS